MFLAFIYLLSAVLVCEARHYDLTVQRISTLDGLPTNIVNRVWQDSTGYVWIETTNGLSRYDGYRISQADDSVRHVSTRSDVLKTRDAEWVRTGDGALERIDQKGNRQSWQMIPPEVLAYTRNDHFHVADVDERTEAVSTYGGGLWLYDKPTGELSCVSEKMKDYAYITYLFVDHTGCIWLAVDNLGVVCVRMNVLNSRWQPLIDKTPIIDRNHIRSITPVGDDHLLLGNQTGELYDYDTQADIIRFAGNAPRRVYTALKDSRGRLWLGTRGGGLLLSGRQIEGLPSSSIYKIQEDSSGHVLVAMLNGGVSRIGDDDISTMLQGKDCHDLLQDNEGRWWVAAEDSLYILEEKETKDIVAHGVLAGFFVCLYKDSSGTVWVGSIGKGLLRCRMDEGKFVVRNYTTGDGLPNNNVYSIIGDRSGNIWVGTEDGLLFLNPRQGDVRNFRFSASLLANVFNERAAVCMPDGRLIFGTHDGLIEIDPVSHVSKGIKPHTAVTSLMVNGENASLEKRTFAYNEQNLTFCFSNFQYSSLSSVLYQYRLEGLDTAWCSPTRDNTAVYRNLSPGRYTFRVRSNNGMGQWGEETAYEFVIRQPWWNTWWAWSLYLLTFAIVMLAVFLFVRRILRLRRQIEVQRQVDAFKTDFYNRLERELRNPVNVLQGATENVQIAGTSKTTVQSLRRGTRRVLKLMDMVRDFNNDNTSAPVADDHTSDLEQRFRDIVDMIHADEPEFRELAPPPINEKTILVVETDEDNLTHLTDTLNPYFRVVGCTTFADCEAKTHESRPSLLLLDISNNAKDAFQLTRQLKTDYPQMPIIHLSSDDDDAHQLLSLRTGASDYIVKPFSSKVLIERMKKCLSIPAAERTDKLSEERSETANEETAPILTDIKERRFLDQFYTVLATHVSETDFSVEEFARLMGLGRAHFYKKVKQLTGETPVAHLQRARLDYAARLLRETNITVEEAMLQAGYRNASHFYSSFKKQFGMSPRDYRLTSS